MRIGTRWNRISYSATRSLYANAIIEFLRRFVRKIGNRTILSRHRHGRPDVLDLKVSMLLGLITTSKAVTQSQDKDVCLWPRGWHASGSSANWMKAPRKAGSHHQWRPQFVSASSLSGIAVPGYLNGSAALAPSKRV